MEYIYVIKDEKYGIIFSPFCHKKAEQPWINYFILFPRGKYF